MTPTLDEAIEKLTGICGIAISDEKLDRPPEDCELLCHHRESLQAILAAMQGAKERIKTFEEYRQVNLKIRCNLVEELKDLTARLASAENVIRAAEKLEATSADLCNIDNTPGNQRTVSKWGKMKHAIVVTREALAKHRKAGE